MRASLQLSKLPPRISKTTTSFMFAGFLFLSTTACGDLAISPSSLQSADSASSGDSGGGIEHPSDGNNTQPIASAPQGIAKTSQKASLASLSLMSNGHQAVFPIYANTTSNIFNCRFDVSHAIIAIHGLERSPDDQVSIMVKNAGTYKADSQATDTLIIAPWFADSLSDLPSSVRLTQTVAYSGSSYTEGGLASQGPSVSSFALLDSLMTIFSDKTHFPNLKQVTLVGHSAGGQTTQRYALVGALASPPASAEFATRFVIANPSSYAFLDSRRVSSTGALSAPSSSKCQSTYNLWKYGLSRIPSRLSTFTTAKIQANYLSRSVHHLLGKNDNNPNDSSMDTSCEAEIQGNTRLVRGRNFFSTLGSFSSSTKHTLCEVPGVGHDSYGMLTSSCAGDVLF